MCSSRWMRVYKHIQTLAQIFPTTPPASMFNDGSSSQSRLLPDSPWRSSSHLVSSPTPWPDPRGRVPLLLLLSPRVSALATSSAWPRGGAGRARQRRRDDAAARQPRRGGVAATSARRGGGATASLYPSPSADPVRWSLLVADPARRSLRAADPARRSPLAVDPASTSAPTDPAGRTRAQRGSSA